jgi:uncharacterized protein YjbI with pentapeptide repeats
MKYEIKNRLTGDVQFTAEINCAEDAPTSLKIGLAVKWAIKARANLARANLAGANLARADLAGAYLAGAYLAGANLAGAYLAHAYLAHANLAGANLARAYLAGANLAGAYLAGADLAGAYLARADLAGAYLADANLAGADGVVDLGTPNGWRAVGWLKDGEPWVRVGCQNKSLADGKVYWSGKSDRREVMAALTYFETVAGIRNEAGRLSEGEK